MSTEHECGAHPPWFHLVEVLVALLILGIMTALGYGTYRQARIAAERTEQSQARTREIEFGMRMLIQDFAQIAPRPVREPIGDGRDPALSASIGSSGLSGSDSSSAFVASSGSNRSTASSSAIGPALVTLTRGGWSNTAGVQRGTLQRVAYRLEKSVLKRSYQPVLDATLASEPTEEDLLTKVKTVQIRYLDNNRSWSEQWPPATLTPPLSYYTRPIAVEVTVEFEDWGKVRRLIEVASG